MLLQIKVYLIAIIYFLGALFMLLYPPRNYLQSGAKLRSVKTVNGFLKYQRYMDYNTIKSEAQRMAREDSEVVTVRRLGPQTANNRTIISLELRSDKQSRKPGILIIAGLNGMAWGAPNAILELAEKLLHDSNYQTPFFNDYDWYLVPSGNPDGLTFTQSLIKLDTINETLWSYNITARNNTKPAIWNKNIDKENKTDFCIGTNINRNFAYHWGDHDTKKPDSCSQLYQGSKPYSTKEASALRAYVDHLGDTVYLAIHLHASFVPKKEYILYPWQYSLRQPSNFRTIQAIGEYAARQSRLPDGRLYEVHQSSSDGIFAGSLSDYISGVVGTELVFQLKPYHQLYPNTTDSKLLEVYVKKSISAILSLVRGWRSSTKQNTLSFFGRDVEF